MGVLFFLPAPLSVRLFYAIRRRFACKCPKAAVLTPFCKTTAGVGGRQGGKRGCLVRPTEQVLVRSMLCVQSVSRRPTD